MTVVAMSHGELSRFDTMMRVHRGELRVNDAAALLGLKRRQVYRLLDLLREDSAEGMISRKRGRPGNRRHSDGLRDRIIAIVREHYQVNQAAIVDNKHRDAALIMAKLMK